MKINKSKITIGLPVYNGEETLKRTLDSLLQQTFTDFILIISDNGSTDSTSKICLEYQKKDSRIKYFFKKNTVSWVWNFIFLVDKADTEYFVWVADDDYWEKDFIEKNILFLNSNPKYVGSVSDVKHFGKYLDNYLIHKNEKFNCVRPIVGTLDEKITNIVEFNWILNVFSIFRTDKLKKCLIRNAFVSWDFALLLNLIKFGDLHVLDEILWHRDSGGNTSSKSFLDALKHQKYSWFKTYFPYIPFTIWCLKNLGLKNLIKHNAYFRYENFHNGKKIIRELIYNIIK
tara:strand:- start:735 stop:1595 length:861 start_codon:yes stop_codon:yes gene_type:complete